MEYVLQPLYYHASDIDFMCNESSVFKFIDAIGEVRDCVQENLKRLQKPSEVTIEPIKTTAIVVTHQFITHKIDEIRDETGLDVTVEDIINDINKQEVREYFLNIYSKTKNTNNKIHRSLNKPSDKNKPLFDAYYKPETFDTLKIELVDYELTRDQSTEKDCETCMYLNDIVDTKVPSDKNIMVLKIAESIKFKLHSAVRRIEAFRAKGSDPFVVVGRFHLGCVRTYGDNKTVHLTPSNITSLMTGINVDYKYFAGAYDPIEILTKYRTRAQSIILNKTEREHMGYYTSKMPNAKARFGIDANKESHKKLFGFRDINDELYKSAHYEQGLPKDVYNKVNRKPIATISDLAQFYKTKLGYDVEKEPVNMLKFKTINDEGTVNVYPSWVSEACWKAAS